MSEINMYYLNYKNIFKNIIVILNKDFIEDIIKEIKLVG